MQLIKVLKKQAVIQGQTKKVLVSIEVESDDVDFSYWDESLIKETQNDLDSGRIQSLWIKVTARFTDLAHFEGVDTLGQVIVRSSMVEKDVRQSVSIHGMSQNAINDLVAQVLQGKSQIDTFLGKVA